ncbi:YhfC family intramembrane metalloprotease [Clostridium baratii]|uniref:Predicted membrane protein n=1 Tax=Clostridium baratii TaxID=1561 RepID=A0A174SSL0_9CLOT|nr:YhfC family glutamic-type intramembrane protease [Clostridium baratii]CUP99716.1 Predicted membrane protein [Clostridium baratii]
MISTMSIIMMLFTTLVSIALPIALIVIMKVKYKASLKSFFIGASAFFITVQCIEGPINYYFLIGNRSTSSIIAGNTILFMLYGGLMAGIFEETARYICFKFILKKERRIQDAISYGIGHGGIEAILLVGITYLANTIVSIMINLGMPLENGLELVSAQLSSVEPYMFAIAGVERLSTIIIQIGLSIIVFNSVKYGKKQYYLLAILIHALIDFPAVLAQKGVINIITVESIMILVSIAFIVFIIKQVKKNKEDLYMSLMNN